MDYKYEYTTVRAKLQLEAAAKVERAAVLIRELTEAACYISSVEWHNGVVKIHCCIYTMYTRTDDFYRWAAAHGAELEVRPGESVYAYEIRCEVDGVIVFALATEADAEEYAAIRNGGQE